VLQHVVSLLMNYLKEFTLPAGRSLEFLAGQEKDRTISVTLDMIDRRVSEV
jgi:hypothetical protein